MPATTVLLAPLVVLAIVALMGFVGCTEDFDELGAGGGEVPGTWTPPTCDTPYREVVLGDLPIAYWRLVDADLMQEAPDEKGPPPLGNPGTFNVTAELDPTQQGLNLSDPAAHSIFFDGGYVTVEVAGNPELAPGAFTIEALAVAEWNAADPSTVRVVASSRDSGANTGWVLYATTDDYWQGQVWAGGQAHLTPKRKIFLNGKTNHLALTYDENGVLRLYVDGQPFLAGVVSGFAPNTTQPICIGAGTAEAPPLNPFKGRIQEVALYTFALTKTQVGSHYCANTATL
jgi:hypothetical protein